MGSGDKGIVALTRTLNEIGEAFELFRETNDERLNDIKSRIDAMEKNGAPTSEVEALRDRVEELEARGSGPGRLDKPRPKWKAHKLGDETIYELPADVRMQDVIKPAKEPPISLDRWLAAAMLGGKCRDREAVEYARLKASVGTGSTGVLVPEEFVSQWIDNLRAQMVLTRAGITTVTMDAKTQTRSRVTADPSVTWHAESGSISASDPTFELRQLVAKTLVSRVQSSVEVAQDSPDFGMQLLSLMGRALAAEIDRAGIRGAGSATEPQGVIGATGVNQVSGVGTLTNYDEFVDAIALLWAANVPEDAVGPILVSPATLKVLRKLKTGITGDETTLVPPPGLPPFLVSSTLDDQLSPPTQSSAAVGDWSDLLLGVRREASLESLRLTTYASNLQLEFVAYTCVDFLIRRPASFTEILGITN